MAKIIEFTQIAATKQGREHEVKVTVKVTENGNPVVNKPVTRSINQGSLRNPKMTNASGFLEFVFKTSDRQVKFTVECEGEQYSQDIVVKNHIANAPATAPATNPAPATSPASSAAPTTTPAQPQNILGAKEHIDAKGNCKIVVRVIDSTGKGVKTDATIEAEGTLHQIKTDKQGNVTFDYPRVIKIGESIKVNVYAPGIVAAKELTLARAAAVPQAKATLEADVLNNGRGRFSVKIRITDAAGNGVPTSAWLSAENQRHEVKTDKHGEAIFNYPRPIAANEVVRAIVSVSGITEQKSLTLSHVPLPKTDPVNLVLRQSHDGNGNFTVFVRVTDSTGNGLAEVVTLSYFDRLIPIRTDCHGQASWQCPDNIQPGNEAVVNAAVSGITDTATIKLCRRDSLPPLPPKYHWRWWLCTNNGRAVIGLLVMLMLWVKCFSAISEVPIIQKPTQKTVAEHNYDEVTKLVEAARKTKLTPEQAAKMDINQFAKEPNFISQPLPPDPKVKKPEGHGKLYVFTLLWTLIALAYAPLSMREEFWGTIQEVKDELRPDETKAGDGLMDKVSSWLNPQQPSQPAQPPAPPAPAATPVVSTAPAQPAQTQSGNQAEAEERKDVKDIKKKVSFMEQFKVEILAEILMAAVPKILSRWFR
ncbi:hypothetical protein HGA34_02830 [Candidatus Falkowbacteria bacterium]|nr:hypothetical protein [Candidatus Falkowbacteria bacterium]